MANFLKVFLVTVFALLVIGTVVAQDDELEGTLQFYPASYYSPEAQPEGAAEVEAVIADYEALHPGVEIDMIPFIPWGEFEVFFQTRLAAGQEPHLSWRHYYLRNPEGEEVWVPLNDYFEMPNPYIPEGLPGHDRWGDVFEERMLEQVRAGDGNWYQISMDWTEGGWHYNTEIFEELGIEPDWTNITEFYEDCALMRENGIEPLGIWVPSSGSSSYQWLDDNLFTEAFSDQVMDWQLPQYMNPNLDWRQLAQEEVAKAIYDGHLSVDNPRFDYYLQFHRDLADNCLIEGFAGISSWDEMARLFIEGEVAIGWFSAAHFFSYNFDEVVNYGRTFMPPITQAENPYSIHEDSMYRVGGPSSPGQMGISQRAANEGLLEEAVDFMMYWTAPQSFERVYDTFPVFMPQVKGLEADSLRFDFVQEFPSRAVTDPVARLTAEFGTTHNRLFQQFMLGEITGDELKTEYQSAMERAVDDLCRDNDWEWCDS
ncbi:MAG: ABC transporter substrate-binding protein [Aggregatilineales bacterium]